MILAIDAGNTHIVLGCLEAKRTRTLARISTDPTKTTHEYAILIRDVLDFECIDIRELEGAIISSVVPQLNRVLKKAVRQLFGVEPLVVGPGIKTGLAIRCDTPSSVGADLICACVAAQSLYGSPCLIIDIGTATKMMVVDDKGAFIGVSIIPGVLMGLDALATGTAQLPNIDLGAPGSIIAKNTIDCMRSGVIFGHACMIDGMIDRIRNEIGKELPVYVTGGLAPVILPHCRHEMVADELLVLKGLHIIYQKNK